MASALRSLIIFVAIGALFACSSGKQGAGPSSRSGLTPVPPEFRKACGHPGAQVQVRHVPVTVRHADCDLTGVLVTYRNYGGAVVADKAGGVGGSGGFSLIVHETTLDVTIDAHGDPGDG